jgi:hypothetical protein
MTIIEHYDSLLMSETSMQDTIYTSPIQRIIEYKIVLGLMEYPPMLITRSRGGALQILEIDQYISIPGVRRFNQKHITPDRRFLKHNITDSTGSSEISSAKTSDFLDFVETKSKSNSWRMTIHLLIFPLITHRVNMY